MNTFFAQIVVRIIYISREAGLHKGSLLHFELVGRFQLHICMADPRDCRYSIECSECANVLYQGSHLVVKCLKDRKCIRHYEGTEDKCAHSVKALVSLKTRSKCGEIESAVHSNRSWQSLCMVRSIKFCRVSSMKFPLLSSEYLEVSAFS